MWLEQSEQGGEGGRAERGQGRSCGVLGTTGRIWIFPERKWEPGRAVDRGQGLTGAHRCPLVAISWGVRAGAPMGDRVTLVTESGGREGFSTGGLGRNLKT